MKILVADDDKEIVELLSIYLHNEGYESVKAYDGKEALTKIRTTSDIELLILDIMMPEMDGMQVVKELRKESQIPIIMLTAKTTDMDKIRGLVAGADDYVTQPIRSYGPGKIAIEKNQDAGCFKSTRDSRSKLPYYQSRFP
jgi:DNA-binding response OmpR family regulator